LLGAAGVLSSAAMEAAGRSGTPVRYWTWQERLARAFLSRDQGQYVIFFTDDDELRDLAPEVPDAAADLAACVTELVDARRVAGMFDAVSDLAASWQVGDRNEPPPTLPVLALSVLAAARMHTDARGMSHNYYLRLAQALLPGADESSVEEARLALRDRAFISVARMWRQLDEWMAEQAGAAGMSTIRDHPELTRIGFPLSQALVRRSDRAVLTRFFDALEIRDLGVPGNEALSEYLRLWAARPRGLSESFLHALGDDVLGRLLSPLVSGLAASWDGRVVSSDGLIRATVAVAVDLEKWTARWVIPSGSSAAADVLRGTFGGRDISVTVEPDPYSSLFRASGLPRVSADFLRAGFRLKGTVIVAELPGTRVLVLREDPDAGGWLSVPAIVPFQEHVIAVSAELFGDLHGVLQDAAEAGWRTVRQPAGHALLSGFAIFRNVSFGDAALLAEAMRTVPWLLRATILPDSTARGRLVNGLPVTRRLGRHYYLGGGEPDLLLPVGDQPRQVPATLDGTPQDPPFSASGWPIELRRIGPFAAGPHDIEVDRDTLRFTVLDADPGQGSLPGTGEIGWDENGELGPAPATVTAGAALTAGAAVAGEDPPAPMLARRGNTLICLVHRDGHVTAVPEPAPVTGPLAEVPGFSSYYFELMAPRSAAWLVEQRGPRRSVRRIRRMAPDFTPLDDFSRRAWEAIAAAGPRDDPLWQLYTRAWERARGR
jgi:hypothetical protein